MHKDSIVSYKEVLFKVLVSLISGVVLEVLFVKITEETCQSVTIPSIHVYIVSITRETLL